MSNKVAGAGKPFRCIGLLLVSFLVLVAGCAQAPQRAGPIEKNDYRFLAEYLDWMIPAEMRRWDVPGVSIVVVDDQQVVWSKGYGFADVANAVPAAPDTLYRVGSVSKLLTATEVMRRVDRGEIGLDRPLADQLPAFSIKSRFQGAKPMTVRSLLAHHSGLPFDYLHGMWGTDPVSLTQLQSALREESLVAPPQTQYKYSNLDYSMLGRLIESKSGEPFAAAIEHQLLRPLGMNRSAFERGSQPSMKHAKGYRKGKELPPTGLRDEPAGSLISSATDMARFIEFVLADGQAGGKPVMRVDALGAMFEPQFEGLPLDFGHRIGLGWMLSGLDVPGAGPLGWHNGAYPGYYTSVLVARRPKLGVAILANGDEAGKFATRVALKALELALEAKQGEPIVPKPAVAPVKPIEISPERAAEYAGDYVVFGNMTKIARKGGRLEVELFDHSLDLVPVASERFVIRKSVLGLVDIAIPEMSIYFTSAQGRRFAVLEGLPAPFAFERIERQPIPQAWQARLGRYRCEGSDVMLEFHKFEIDVEDGVLVARVNISRPISGHGPSESRVALDPVSDSEAVVIGAGYTEGSVLHSERAGDEDRIGFSGYWCSRVDEARR
jgi:CubicO group peptidase (beta-lactamase class C family)